MFSTGVMADATLYVGDEVKIPMRADASITKGNIITSLGINEPVTLIKSSNGWSNIEYKDKQGWMITRYLTSTKPVNAKADELKNQIANLNKKNANQHQTILDVNQRLETQQKETSMLSAKVTQYGTQVLEVNKLRNKVSDMDDTNTDLVGQIMLLKGQNNASHSTDFLTIVSTLMLLLGLVIGFIINRANANRARSIYSI
jgi:SH3 domain protein